MDPNAFVLSKDKSMQTPFSSIRTVTISGSGKMVRKLAMVSYIFQMEVIIQAHFKTTRQRERESCIIRMETIIRGIGKMIRLMGMENISQQLEENMQEIGRRISVTVKEMRLGLIRLLMREIMN